MTVKISKPFWQTVSLGALAGMRTFSAPAVASHILSRRTSGHLAKSSLDFMQNEKAAKILTVLAVGEFVGDKLPSVPDRINTLGITFRCIAGSLAGASIYKASGNNALTGAVLGSVAAFGSTFASYYLRKNTVNKFHIFDPLVGALEDTLVIGAGVGLINAK